MDVNELVWIIYFIIGGLPIGFSIVKLLKKKLSRIKLVLFSYMIVFLIAIFSYIFYYINSSLGFNIKNSSIVALISFYFLFLIIAFFVGMRKAMGFEKKVIEKDVGKEFESEKPSEKISEEFVKEELGLEDIIGKKPRKEEIREIITEKAKTALIKEEKSEKEMILERLKARLEELEKEEKVEGLEKEEKYDEKEQEIKKELIEMKRLAEKPQEKKKALEELEIPHKVFKATEELKKEEKTKKGLFGRIIKRE